MSEYRHSEFVPLATLDSDPRPELCLLFAEQMVVMKVRNAVAQSCEVTVTRVEERAGVRFIATAPDHEAVIARLQEALHVTDVARLVALQDLDEVERLRALVRELSDDLAVELDARYEGTLHHHVMKRRRERDMNVIHRARAVLEGCET